MGSSDVVKPAKYDRCTGEIGRRESPALRLARRCLSPLGRVLKTDDEHATIDRLFTSQHVHDLQLIAGLVILGAVVIIGVGFPLVLYRAVEPPLVKILNRGSLPKISLALALSQFDSMLSALQPVLTVFAPVLAASWAVLAWTYQVGSARLGVVDLFACEISTLCRAIRVTEGVRRYTDRFSRGSPEPYRNTGSGVSGNQAFSSQENYFPVFESCTKDLQTLEANVVVHITAFYTFMKAVRDSARTLSAIDSMQGPNQSAISGNEGISRLIYMMFLGLESARNALCYLVEYDPEHAERITVVLISELEAFRFLCDHFTDQNDTYYQRLTLRIPEYRRIVLGIVNAVNEGLKSSNSKAWEPAYGLLPKLKERYEATLGRNVKALAAAK